MHYRDQADVHNPLTLAYSNQLKSCTLESTTTRLGLVTVLYYSILWHSFSGIQHFLETTFLPFKKNILPTDDLAIRICKKLEVVASKRPWPFQIAFEVFMLRRWESSISFVYLKGIYIGFRLVYVIYPVQGGRAARNLSKRTLVVGSVFVNKEQAKVPKD